VLLKINIIFFGFNRLSLFPVLSKIPAAERNQDRTEEKTNLPLSAGGIFHIEPEER